MTDAHATPHSSAFRAADPPEALLNAVFSALSAPPRRAILQRLAQGSANVGELAEPLGISLPAVSRHLKVLEAAGLISKEVRAQQRYCALQADTLHSAWDWLGTYSRFWNQQFNTLDAYLQAHQDANKEPHDSD